MKRLFDTHRCTKICKFLELSGKNEKWKRDWHDDRTRRHSRLHHHQQQQQAEEA